MFSIPLHIAIICWIVGIGLGYWIATLRSGGKPSFDNRAGNGRNTQDAKSDLGGIDNLLRSLRDLTSQVDFQMGEHSLRVGEISSAIDGEDVKGEMILQAGKLLVEANEHLQSDLREAQHEIERQRTLSETFLKQSRTDSLTELPNRRAFDQQLNETLKKLHRKPSPFSLVIVDIDHFKKVNDQHGHLIGDQMLKKIAQLLKNSFRADDFIARYGGEEFAAIVPLSEQDAAVSAEGVRKSIALKQLTVGTVQMSVTVSMGVTPLVPHAEETDLVQRADQALYKAKQTGRNRIYIHDGTKILPTT